MTHRRQATNSGVLPGALGVVKAKPGKPGAKNIQFSASWNLAAARFRLTAGDR